MYATILGLIIDFRKQSFNISIPPSYALRLLSEKGKIKFGGISKMEMLVTKFLKGKYRNEGDLFTEPISVENFNFMGEMIALLALRTAKKSDLKIVDKFYIGLIKDLYQMNETNYIESDEYDCAQTAMCFLYQFFGKTVHEIYGKDKKGKELRTCARPVLFRGIPENEIPRVETRGL